MSATYHNTLKPQLDFHAGSRLQWGRLYGCAPALALVEAAQAQSGLFLVVTPDTPSALRLENELRFFARGSGLEILSFPDWETLPYDIFSPHQDIISQRLTTLYRLPQVKQGLLVVPVDTLMHRLAERSYVEGHSLQMHVGEQLDLDTFRLRLENTGYRYVSQVMEHGEFTVRGSLLDLYPMGNKLPLRVDLFDDEIETIRTFDPETQRTLEQVVDINLLPAREFPVNEEAIKRFRQNYREAFEGNPTNSLIYRDVSDGIAPPGIEYYLPLFFEQTATLFDYLPEQTLLVSVEDIHSPAAQFWHDAEHRYEQRRHNVERPILSPEQIYLRENELFERVNRLQHILIDRFEQHSAAAINYATAQPPELTLNINAAHPTHALEQFLGDYHGRVLFVAESTGRREFLLNLLKGCDIHPTTVNDWQAFRNGSMQQAITVMPLDRGLVLDEPALALICETQLFGQHAMTKRQRKAKQRDADAIVRNLAELEEGAPVVHEDNGVGRYLGLQILDIGGMTQEFLTLEYSGGDKLYVPVSSLHLISRYTGADPETAPLHRLGSGQWEKARRKAQEKVRDVAAELLDIYARREAREGRVYSIDEQYAAFAASFPFEETADQSDAIAAVIQDMAATQPMDRLVCGDVGFGKTEVAIRAAFIAAQNGLQVAMLVPTTLLAQQHYQSFSDRFADWPIRIESLSRFRTKGEQDEVLQGLESGSIDIVIGTHKLLQKSVKYKNLGLVIIDEEHRFGVRQKELFKSLRSEIDVLSLTATPIPRTLNMAFSGLREFSVISTPPARRLPVKTFITPWDDAQISEAVQREIKRGGQVYFLHNEVETIERMAEQIQTLIPEAHVRFAHGQMGERALENAMSDFYHQRFNILVCTTIIETGIDIPSANTIIINRADRFGLAQLYQLRGRVGRSHHRAYAYLLVPPKGVMSADAVKRLEAIESIEDLGTGFTLATHDLEIRGAGELLGDEQSGQMQAIGFTLYTELLERAVEALKSGKEPDLERPLDHGAEVDLHIPALIPEDYLPDVHSRLVMYKRIASADNEEELRELQVEMIDRFGLLPEQVKNLFAVTELKLKAKPLGITKIDAGQEAGYLQFSAQPDVDPMKIINLIQSRPKLYKLEGTEKLRFYQDMAEREQRIDALHQLLDNLS